MFPLDIKLTKELSVKYSTPDKNNEILEFLKQELAKLEAGNVRIEHNLVKFNNKFFKTVDSWNIMFPVDKGTITVTINSKSEILIEYLFSLRVTLIFGVFAGIIFNLFSKDWTVGLLAFLWIGGMNWLIAIIRHSIMFRNLNKKLKESIIE